MNIDGRADAPVMADHDDLHAEPTEGFRVGEKKTIDEYQQLGTSLPWPPPLSSFVPPPTHHTLTPSLAR